MSQPPAAVQSTMKAASERARNRARAPALSPGPWASHRITHHRRSTNSCSAATLPKRPPRVSPVSPAPLAPLAPPSLGPPRPRREEARARQEAAQWQQAAQAPRRPRRRRCRASQRRRAASRTAAATARAAHGKLCGACCARTSRRECRPRALANRQAAGHPRPAPLRTPSPPLLPLPHPRRAPPARRPPPRQAFSAEQLSTEACEAVRRALPRASRTAVHKASRACGPLYDWTGAQLTHAEALQQARVHRACAAADMCV